MSGRGKWDLMPDNLDLRIRLATFAWLKESSILVYGVFPRDVLASGFMFQGNRVPLIGPQGIFEPAVIPEIPLSITTTTGGPYEDSEDENGRLLYAFMGTDPNHWQNKGLMKAMELQVPLVYFKALMPGRYAASFPAYIVGIDTKNLMFTVEFGDAESTFVGTQPGKIEIPRAYATQKVKVRLHQQEFREIVLDAYEERCTCCRLGHRKLLDAAHIIPDKEPEGLPIVKNGLALCKLHHAAFDSNLFGIRPDHVIEVRKDILGEKDGPMLVHGLQELHDKKIIAPRNINLAPDKDLLEMRFEQFHKAG